MWGMVLPTLMERNDGAISLYFDGNGRNRRGAYAGTAMGVTSTMSMLGGFFSPPLGKSLADISLGLSSLDYLFLFVILNMSLYNLIWHWLVR